MIPIKFDERWTKLMTTKNGIEVYDAKHAIEQFEIRFPNLEKRQYFKVLRMGLDKIAYKFNDEQGQYSIQSLSTNIKIQIELRPDDKNRNLLRWVTATTLNRLDHPFDKGHPKKVIVENSVEHIISDLKKQSKRGYIDFYYKDSLFMEFFENGEHHTTFEIIEVT